MWSSRYITLTLKYKPFIMNKIKLPVNSYKKLNLENNTPILFNKKSKQIILKPLTYIKSDTGKMRHFTPAAQEWYNSIYTYNNNYIKSLPSADKNLMSLLKSYFNFQIKAKLLIGKPNAIPSKNKNKGLPKPKRISIRDRRLSTKKVFVGRGDLKHTNNNVIITFYLYNTEGMFLARTFKSLSLGLFYPRNDLKKFINKDRNGKKNITYNRIFSLYEYLSLRDHYFWYLLYITSIINKFNTLLTLINTYYKNLRNLVEMKVLTENEKNFMFNEKIKSYNVLTYPDYKVYLNKAEIYYKREWFKYFYLLKLNKEKYTQNFIAKLNFLVNNIYNKKVVFNIVNLKKMHLSSDIFTQIVALKLRIKENKLYRVLKSSLRKIKLPPVSKISERLGKPNKDEFLVNRIRNNTITSMFINDNHTIDSLSNLLSDFYPSVYKLRRNIIKRSYMRIAYVSLRGYVLKTLKHLKLRGIRVEAKGRLTRRARASRSVFKMKWKGGLKNVDSSFRGLSTVMLRGHVKSNVQYSLVNTKNRKGAFGVKGWVSNK